MISERELLAAIKLCEKDPVTLNSCEKLAVYYTVYDHLFGSRGYGERSSTASHGENERIFVPSPSSEFLKSVEGKDTKRVWAVLDELLSTIKIINPRLYDGVLRRLDE